VEKKVHGGKPAGRRTSELDPREGRAFLLWLLINLIGISFSSSFIMKIFKS
jgi:hypothetical protein